MLPSPLITSSTTPFSVKDILKLELQQQSQQHQLQFISCFGLSGALSQPGPFPNKPFRSHSPPSCMLAGMDSPSPVSSGLSESEERMSYLNTLPVQDRLAEPGLPGEMFGNPAQNHSAELRRGTEQEDRDSIGAPNPYSYNGYPAYSYNNSVYTNTYSCTYSSLPALPPSNTTANAFMNMNLGNLGAQTQSQASQGPVVTPCQGTLQGIRAW
ncbi:hypothetical protein FQN60_015016 [Etheostoma spectabile]|uniref:Uncharacterized protein n=1 Tax=Etheostoma spectabile TaxID=54343 RepID=A0A5J5CNZ6_9PERO|nr:hypothetical protein FQN60_015016 [Etheostoma spectabile]